MIEELDFVVGGDGEINYSEFLAATLDMRTFLKDSKLRAVFSMFDTENRGIINEKNMKLAFEKLGFNVPLA